MFFVALRDSIRYPVVWVAAAVYAVLDVVQLLLSLQGETFFSVRLLVIEYLILPFLLAGTYGVLRDEDASIRHFGAGGVENYFRVLLPGIVLAFFAVVILVLLLLPLSILGAGLSTDLIAGAALALMIPVLFFSFLYDTAACFEGLGVFDSLRRSFALVLAHLWEVIVFILTILALLLGLAFVLLVGWTTILFEQLSPLASLPAGELATFGPGQLAAMIGTPGLALSALFYWLYIVVSFVLVTTGKARLFRSVAEATPPEPQGTYDEKGRYYRY